MPLESEQFKEALSKALVPTVKIHQGDIFSVGDDPQTPIVKFPENSLPPESRHKKKRKFHKQRYVLIIQDDKVNEDIAFPYALIVPLSHLGRETEYTVSIPTQYLAGHIPGDSLALVHLTQPILKIFLREKVGNVPIKSEVFTKVRATYLRLLGII